MKFFLGERFCKGKKLVCDLFFFAYFAYVIVFIYKIKKWLKYWILRHFIRNSILYIKIYFCWSHCGHSSTAERQIVDLLIGVRFPVVTPRSHSRAVRQRHLTA